jgi:hypothetical protein
MTGDRRRRRLRLAGSLAGVGLALLLPALGRASTPTRISAVVTDLVGDPVPLINAGLAPRTTAAGSNEPTEILTLRLDDIVDAVGDPVGSGLPVTFQVTDPSSNAHTYSSSTVYNSSENTTSASVTVPHADLEKAGTYTYQATSGFAVSSSTFQVVNDLASGGFGLQAISDLGGGEIYENTSFCLQALNVQDEFGNPVIAHAGMAAGSQPALPRPQAIITVANPDGTTTQYTGEISDGSAPNPCPQAQGNSLPSVLPAGSAAVHVVMNCPTPPDAPTNSNYHFPDLGAYSLSAAVDAADSGDGRSAPSARSTAGMSVLFLPQSFLVSGESGSPQASGQPQPVLAPAEIVAGQQVGLQAQLADCVTQSASGRTMSRIGGNGIVVHWTLIDSHGDVVRPYSDPRQPPYWWAQASRTGLARSAFTSAYTRVAAGYPDAPTSVANPYQVVVWYYNAAGQKIVLTDPPAPPTDPYVPGTGPSAQLVIHPYPAPQPVQLLPLTVDPLPLTAGGRLGSVSFGSAAQPLVDAYGNTVEDSTQVRFDMLDASGNAVSPGGTSNLVTTSKGVATWNCQCVLSASTGYWTMTVVVQPGQAQYGMVASPVTNPYHSLNGEHFLVASGPAAALATPGLPLTTSHSPAMFGTPPLPYTMLPQACDQSSAPGCVATPSNTVEVNTGVLVVDAAGDPVTSGTVDVNASSPGATTTVTRSVSWGDGAATLPLSAGIPTPGVLRVAFTAGDIGSSPDREGVWSVQATLGATELADARFLVIGQAAPTLNVSAQHIVAGEPQTIQVSSIAAYGFLKPGSTVNVRMQDPAGGPTHPNYLTGTADATGAVTLPLKLNPDQSQWPHQRYLITAGIVAVDVWGEGTAGQSLGARTYYRVDPAAESQVLLKVSRSTLGPGATETLVIFGADRFGNVAERGAAFTLNVVDQAGVSVLGGTYVAASDGVDAGLATVVLKGTQTLLPGTYTARASQTGTSATAGMAQFTVSPLA